MHRNNLIVTKMKEPAIFLVDDDEDDVYLARLTFAAHFPEWTLTSFDDGQALIDHFATHPDALPDLIILDLNMPRLTGFETLTILKRIPKWKKVPVAILSTSSNINDQTRSQAMVPAHFWSSRRRSINWPYLIGRKSHLRFRLTDSGTYALIRWVNVLESGFSASLPDGPCREPVHRGLCCLQTDPHDSCFLQLVDEATGAVVAQF